MTLVIAAFIMITSLSIVAILRLEAERQSEQFTSLKRPSGKFAD